MVAESFPYEYIQITLNKTQSSDPGTVDPLDVLYEIIYFLLPNTTLLRRRHTQRIDHSAEAKLDWKVGIVSMRGMHYPKNYDKKVAITEWL